MTHKTPNSINIKGEYTRPRYLIENNLIAEPVEITPKVKPSWREVALLSAIVFVFIFTLGVCI